MIIKKIKQNLKNKLRRYRTLVQSYNILRGKRYYNKLQKQVGENTHIILIRGATGDVYFQFLLLNGYLKQNNIEKYAIFGDGAGLNSISRLFYCSDCIFIPNKMCECIEKAYLFLDGYKMNMIIPFCWSDNFTFNKCRVRMTEKFNFMDTYIHFSYRMNSDVKYRHPKFNKKKEKQIFTWQSHGIIENRTVIISPDANSVTHLPVWFWNIIIKELQQMGYVVFMNCNYFTYYRAPNIFPSYGESVPLLEYAGFFIGVRSGFCDIISSAKCKKIIIYPQVQDKIDYSSHRSELEFSGLEIMNLYHGADLSEISTPLIRNITDKDYSLEGLEDYYVKLEQLHDQIINQFRGGQ